MQVRFEVGKTYFAEGSSNFNRPILNYQNLSYTRHSLCYNKVIKKFPYQGGGERSGNSLTNELRSSVFPSKRGDTLFKISFESVVRDVTSTIFWVILWYWTGWWKKLSSQSKWNLMTRSNCSHSVY